MKILKTLIHPLTEAQRAELGDAAEIVELKEVRPMLATFLANTTDDDGELAEKAEELIQLCHQYDAVLLPCGSPKFAWTLAQLWIGRRVEARPLFAHSIRSSVEKEVDKFEPIPGELDKFKKVKVVEKSAVFNHIRWF